MKLMRHAEVKSGGRKLPIKSPSGDQAIINQVIPRLVPINEGKTSPAGKR
jgi:hypothetical protein